MNMNLKTFVERYTAGDFNSKDVSVQCEAGWYDWFCSDKSLLSRLKSMGSKVTGIVNSPKFDKEKVYVFFKNNCPLCGPLYDSFSICDLETNKVLFWVSPKYYFNDNKATVFAAPDFDTPVAEGKWSDIKKYFME